jgi:hypothetical protein
VPQSMTAKTQRVPLSQLAIERGWTYLQTYNAALRGELGDVERVGRRIFILREAPHKHRGDVESQ